MITVIASVIIAVEGTVGKENVVVEVPCMVIISIVVSIIVVVSLIIIVKVLITFIITVMIFFKCMVIGYTVTVLYHGFRIALGISWGLS